MPKLVRNFKLEIVGLFFKKCSSETLQATAADGKNAYWLPGGNFEFEGLVTETLLLGNIAVRAGQKLNWDRASMKVLNSDAAQKFVAPERRKGWEL